MRRKQLLVVQVQCPLKTQTLTISRYSQTGWFNILAMDGGRGFIPELDPREICFSSILGLLADPSSAGLVGSREFCLRCVVVGSGWGLCAVSLIVGAGQLENWQ